MSKIREETCRDRDKNCFSSYGSSKRVFLRVHLKISTAPAKLLRVKERFELKRVHFSCTFDLDMYLYRREYQTNNKISHPIGWSSYTDSS